MIAEQFWEALRAMPIGTLARLTGGRPFVVLSPHPDDESLGAGGLIAAAREAALRVEVIVLTDGAGSHPNSAEYPPDRLVELRRSEAAAAADRLGVPRERLTHLNLPDTRAPMAGPEFERAVDRIKGVVDKAAAASIFVTWRHDPHCDHEAADAMARALRRRKPALNLWSYPIWGWHLDPTTQLDAPPPRGFRLDIAAWLGAKQAAIAAHASQMTDLIADDPDGFRFDDRTIAPFLGAFEYFFEVPQ